MSICAYEWKIHNSAVDSEILEVFSIVMVVIKEVGALRIKITIETVE
jgi:hypothetical protein